MITLLWVLLILVFILAIFIWLSFRPTVNIYSTARLKTKKKVIALTFDDGPDPISTPKILELLTKEKIKASFFVVGKNVEKHPEILKETFKRGHLIANHSYNHRYFVFSRKYQLLANLDKTSGLIDNVINKQPKIYRPPYGLRLWWLAKAVHEAGYNLVTWDNMTLDYWGMSAASIKRNILNKVKPGGVIVMHDGHEGLARSNNHVVEALSEIISELKKNGYKFARIDELFNISGYKQ